MPVQSGPDAVTGDTDNVRPMLSVLSSGRAVLVAADQPYEIGAVDGLRRDQRLDQRQPGRLELEPVHDDHLAGRRHGREGNITRWGQLDVTGGKLYNATMSQRYVSGTGWQPAQPVAPAIVVPTGFIATPMLTVNENGVAAAMWAEGGAVLQASVSDASGNWGPLQKLTEHLNGAALRTRRW